MIKVERISCPSILKTGNPSFSVGELETRDAIIFFSDSTNLNKKYQKTGKNGGRTKQTFSVYSEKSVRKILQKMFHGKCAYCESKITAIYPGDIEHFRPKGGYINDDEPLSKPGYYWLAADWGNLLLACPFCNQTNTHEISENGGIKEIVQGKLNQFPLESEVNRLKPNHGNIYFTDKDSYKQAFDLEENTRLLLKPCTDENIDKYFKYDDSGVVLTNEVLSDVELRRAQTSITVYALQRLGLVQSREAKIIEVKAQIRRVEEALLNYNNNMDKSGEEPIWFEGILRRELQILADYKKASQEYAGLARYIIDKYFHDSFNI
ncbi:MAG: hypothetical protein ACJA2S_005128 [Cyclobacteriaceae bacterium]|jgi:uncharacterized protein (TIGR02646 family)